ncbi:MAG: ATP synthase F1 subunit delta [Acidobacteria bacterium]|nr:ATP synthase F1 subunit delta [Acidobacteriota bacterium]
MSSFDDTTLAVAKVYASAMLQLAEARGEADRLSDEIAQLASYAASNENFHDFLTDPLADLDERAESLERMFRGRASDLLVDSLQVLNRKGRIGLLAAVAEVLAEALDDLRGRVAVQVKSAVPLTDDLRTRLAAAVKKSTGSEARLQESVDPALVGGMVVQIGDSKMDASVVSRLKGLRAAMLARASKQIYGGAHVES